MTNSIDSSLLLSNYQQAQRKAPSNVLGKDDFLKLLMTQLQNQDPSSPMQDNEFIAQMAQFSSLEQMTNLNSTFEKFIKQQQQSQLISYNQFLGKEITWHKLTELENGTSEIEEGTGKVASIQFKEESVVFTLADGTLIEPGNVSKVNEFSNESSLIQASMMIGKKVTYLNSSNESVTDTIKSVSFHNGKTLFQLNDGITTIKATDMTKIE